MEYLLNINRQLVFLLAAGGGRWSIGNVVGGRLCVFVTLGGQCQWLIDGLCWVTVVCGSYMNGTVWSVVGDFVLFTTLEVDTRVNILQQY